ncbi:epoxide hydrolase-like protein [Pleomassaria siparia CBS 279.74]|uniref:Epoxide hydrolase-like protein n=1 Tax=Pleomassaria siparia CBS 279.74 TaxID=1314801 RepID=A0A6G1KB64_9PLEO|nr:epoxide hydrolase-like protein [Pleomassaria siparia CBS 279.74]
MAPPKAILFDIGGVCVISPFQAILDYEKDNNIPIGWINHSIQKGPHDAGAWQLIERGECVLDDEWFAAFKKQLSVPEHWSAYWVKHGQGKEGESVPKVPDIDSKRLFWDMMRTSRRPDPFMYPALKALRPHFILGALSNTVAFPDGILDDKGVLFSKGLTHDPPPNPHAADSHDIQTCFDVFISSAHVGLRKPDPRAYDLAVRELGKISEERGSGPVTAQDVLFLDDIGVNLKWAKKSGLRTIKVNLGDTKVAVRELERETGMSLLLGEDKAKL